jgi:hypothetical protein
MFREQIQQPTFSEKLITKKFMYPKLNQLVFVGFLHVKAAPVRNARLRELLRYCLN